MHVKSSGVGSWVLTLALVGCTPNPASTGATPEPTPQQGADTGAEDLPAQPGDDEPAFVSTDLPTEPPNASSLMGRLSSGWRVVVDTDRGSLWLHDPLSSLEIEHPLEGEPDRLLTIGDEVFVALRVSGEVVRLRFHPEAEHVSDAIVEVGRRTLGAEPTDLAISPDRAHLYVTLSQQDEVLRLDPTDFTITARTRVPGQPRWVTVDATYALVATARDAHIVRIPIAGGDLQTWTPPTVQRFRDEGCPQRDLDARITGAPAVLDGVVYVPILLSDTQLGTDIHGFDAEGNRPSEGGGSFDTDAFHTGGFDTDGFDTDGFTGPDTGLSGPGQEPPEPIKDCEEPPDLPSPGGYGQPPVVRPDMPFGSRLGRFTPVLWPATTSDGFKDEPIRLSVQARRFDLFTATPELSARPTGHRALRDLAMSAAPGDVAVMRNEAGWDLLAVPHPGNGVVQILSPVAPTPDNDSKVRFHTVPRTVQDDSLLGVRALTVGEGEVFPSGVAEITMWSPTERRLHTDVLATPSAFSAMADERFAIDVHTEDPSARQPGPSPLPVDVQLGRRLFFSTVSDSMSIEGSGVSCGTCHMEGRDDGRTWSFLDMDRQTPSLAGRVSLTAPVAWAGDVLSVQEEIALTTNLRMGGSGVSIPAADAIAAYVDSTRLPKRPTLDANAVARGEALFERPDVACASCHSGSARTDNRTWAVLGFGTYTATPTLRGVGATAPYFHDGSAATLREVLLRARDGSMGNTGSLTDAELDDLEAYLMSL